MRAGPADPRGGRTRHAHAHCHARVTDIGRGDTNVASPHAYSFHHAGVTDTGRHGPPVAHSYPYQLASVLSYESIVKEVVASYAP